MRGWWVLLLLTACGRLGFDESTIASDGSPQSCTVTDYTTTTISSGGAPRAAVAADFNGDGRPDLAVVNGDEASTINAVSVSLSSAEGTFAPRVDLAAGKHPWSIAAGDLDNDGDIDLVVGLYGADQLAVYKNTGAGAFAAAVIYPAAGSPQSVALGDFDRDGDLDAAVTANLGNQVLVLRNAGDGTFGQPDSYATPMGPYQVVAADLDGDGVLDLASCEVAAAVTVFRGVGDGTFASGVDYATGTPTQPWSIAAGDLDGDGSPDLAYTNNFTTGPFAGTAGVLRNLGNGTFGSPTNITLAGDVGELWWIEIADTDGDGKRDLAVADASTQVVHVVRGRGDGSFDPPVDRPVADRPLGLALADFDGNGGLDIATASQSANETSVLFATCQ